MGKSAKRLRKVHRWVAAWKAAVQYHRGRESMMQHDCDRIIANRDALLRRWLNTACAVNAGAGLIEDTERALGRKA